MGLSKFRAYPKLEEALCLLIVDEHRAKMPTNFKHITQLAYKQELEDADVEYFQRIMGTDEYVDHMANPEGLATKASQLNQKIKTQWHPLRLSSSPFMRTIGTSLSIFPSTAFDGNCPSCEHEYSLDVDGCITTTFKTGYLLAAYLRDPIGDDGHVLMPDNGDLKEALFHFILHRYFLKRAIRKEQGAAEARDYHRMMYGMLKTKAAGALNSPTIDELENIKDQRDHLVPRTNRYSSLFTKLNNKEVETDFNTHPSNRYTY